MHGTKNIIANRRMAVSERSLIGRAAGYRGSIPFYDCWESACKRRFESSRSHERKRPFSPHNRFERLS